VHEETSRTAQRREHRAQYAWLLPWLLASVGFLMTLALLR
jgi:hypothetical protein